MAIELQPVRTGGRLLLLILTITIIKAIIIINKCVLTAFLEYNYHSVLITLMVMSQCVEHPDRKNTMPLIPKHASNQRQTHSLGPSQQTLTKGRQKPETNIPSTSAPADHPHITVSVPHRSICTTSLHHNIYNTVHLCYITVSVLHTTSKSMHLCYIIVYVLHHIVCTTPPCCTVSASTT